MSIHKHLPHISRIWVSDPIFFITTCTFQRKPILANSKIVDVLIAEWKDALARHGWMVGRYVVMPDHVHFFCSYTGKSDGSKTQDLSGFMQQWKQWTSKRIISETRNDLVKITPPVWQKEFFDHLLRTEESFSQKWEYVRENPVRKNLVKTTEDWPWQGEIFDLLV